MNKRQRKVLSMLKPKVMNLSVIHSKSIRIWMIKRV